MFFQQNVLQLHFLKMGSLIDGIIFSGKQISSISALLWNDLVIHFSVSAKALLKITEGFKLVLLKYICCLTISGQWQFFKSNIFKKQLFLRYNHTEKINLHNFWYQNLE